MNSSGIESVVVAGAGTMGSLVAWAFATNDINVTIFNRSEAGLERANRVLTGYRAMMEESERVKADEHLTLSTSKDCLIDADFLIENIAEDLEIKQNFFRETEEAVRKDCILTTNTSGLSITKIASVLEHPERFAGMHWFNPANLVPLVEVVSGEQTATDTADVVYGLAKRLQKEPIRVKDVPGFAANRLQLALLREAIHMAEEGVCSVKDIDRAMTCGLGMRYACVGPFETTDLGGIDVFYKIASYLYADLADDKEPQKLLKDKFEKGELGLKSGTGFYDYSGNKGAEAVQRRDAKLQAYCDLVNRNK